MDAFERALSELKQKAAAGHEAATAERKIVTIAKQRSYEYFSDMPLSWVRMAGQISSTAGLVGVALWWKRKVSNQKVIALTPELLGKFGLNARRGRRGLVSLEMLSLVKVDRHKGRSPRVTIQELGSE